MSSPDSNAMTLEPDDPRISEWIDGRLPAAEAAAIERAVEATPRLAALVADLRAIKGGARSLSATAPPGGFTERVMALVAKTAAAESGSDPAVDAEWQAIEAERIAAERAEAAAALAESAHEPSRSRWPWMALIGALAAGLLVTFVLNLPGDGRRDVALAPALEGDRGGPPAIPEADLPQADLIAATEEKAAAATAAAPLDLDDAEANAARSLAAGKPAPPAAFAAKSAALSPAAPAGPPAGGGADVVVVTVRGPAGRAAFERRAAALGLALAGLESDLVPDAADALREEVATRRARQTLPDVIAISGSAAAIETLLAETSSRSQAEAFGRQSLRAPAAVGGRVLVRLIELPEPAEPAESVPGATKP